MSIHHPDHQPYRNFTKRQQVDKAVQTFHGLVRGITIDGKLNTEEVAELLNWTRESADLIGRAPFNELKQKLDEILADGQIDPEEQEDLLWVCRNLSPESDEQEQQVLGSFFEDFIEFSFAKRVRDEGQRVKARLPKTFTLPGICSMCPEIAFDGRVFTFTGTSSKATRKQIADQITELGAAFAPNVTAQTHYLVVGAGGNPCWAFSCYGRKVEKAIDFRKSGNPILIIHESDFWDAVADNK